jgi:hypothetical protein
MAARAMPAFVGPEALGLAVGLGFLVLNWAAGIK